MQQFKSWKNFGLYLLSIAATGAVSAVVSQLGGDASAVPGACIAAANTQAAAALGVLAGSVVHARVLHLV